MFDGMLPIIEKTAPLVARVLLSPYGEAISLVVTLLSRIFEIEDKDPQKIMAKMHEDPEAGVKLAQLQAQLPDELKKYIIEKLKLPDEAEINIKLKWD